MQVPPVHVGFRNKEQSGLQAALGAQPWSPMRCPHAVGSDHGVSCRYLHLARPPGQLQLCRAGFWEQVCRFPWGSSPLLRGTAALLLLFLLLLFLAARAEETAGEGFAGGWQQLPQPGREPIHLAGFAPLSMGVAIACPGFPQCQLGEQPSLLQGSWNQGSGQ